MSPSADSATSPTLTLCMIVKNEAQNLARCLESVRGLADEMVLVDTGSTDETVALATGYGARIFHHTWQNDFAAARNVALGQAAGSWILHLDADEELATESRPRLKAALAQTAADALRVTVRSFNPPSDLVPYSDSQQERLFRNRAEFRYEQPIHELIVNSILRHGGTVGDSDLVIWHYGYLQKQVQGADDRFQRNLRMLEQAAAASPQDPTLCARLGFGYYEAGQFTLAHTYLRRTVVDLDCRHLMPEFMETVLWALWNTALILQDYPIFTSCAKAMQNLHAEGVLPARVLYALARTRLFEGERSLQQAAEASLDAPDALEQFQTASQVIQQALDYWGQLRSTYPLTASAAERVETDLRVGRSRLEAAQQALAAAGRRAAAREVLRRLLAVEDVASALTQIPDALRPDLAAVTRSEAASARNESDVALAEGLEALVEWFEQAPEAKAPPEA